jgi:hypothetical protein
MQLSARLFKSLLGSKDNTPDIRAALLTRWFFNAATVLTGLFLHVMIYEKYQSVGYNAFLYGVMHTALMCALCGVGIVARHFSLSAHVTMRASAVLLIISFGAFLLPESRASIVLFMILFGVGQGLYWLSNNVYELTLITDVRRDRYASALIAGRKLVAILAPALGTLSVLISRYLGLGTYTVVLALSMFAYVACLVVTTKLPPYAFQAVKEKQVRQWIRSPHFPLFQFFTGATALHEVVGALALPLVAFAILGGVVEYGVLTTCASIIGMGGVYVASLFRTRETRIFYLAIGFCSIGVAAILQGIFFTIPFLILFTIIERTLLPLGAVSLHALALFSIERMSSDAAPVYTSMLLRDLSLWVWRLVAVCIVMLVSSITTFFANPLQGAAVLYGCAALFLFYTGMLLHRTRGKKSKI